MTATVRVALTLFALATACAKGATPRQFEAADRTAITAVLDAQVAAWNRGDLVAYMEGYAKTDALVFTSGGKVRRGWQATFDAYQKRYGQDPKAMGKLVFVVQSIDPIGADGAVALGEWQLTESPADGSGIFSVVLERRPEGWRVVHDHTSAAPVEAPAQPGVQPAAQSAPADAKAAAMAFAAGDPKWRLPANWRDEIIPFPLDFAKDIAHQGFEDLRFPPGFFDPKAIDYWSYAFVWRTQDAAALDDKALADELTRYFRGLVRAVDEKGSIDAASRSKIVATARAAGPRFDLTAHVFDAFKTKQAVDLVGWAERKSCKTGALWVFVLAREEADAKFRAELDALAKSADCAR